MLDEPGGANQRTRHRECRPACATIAHRASLRRHALRGGATFRVTPPLRKRLVLLLKLMLIKRMLQMKQMLVKRIPVPLDQPRSRARTPCCEALAWASIAVPAWVMIW